jgi:hypothetical protein
MDVNQNATANMRLKISRLRPRWFWWLGSPPKQLYSIQ